MDAAEILLTLEPLTFLGDDDDGNVVADVAFFGAMEMSSRERLGLLHRCSERDIEEELRKVLARLGKRVSHGAKDQSELARIPVPPLLDYLLMLIFSQFSLALSLLVSFSDGEMKPRAAP